MPAIVPVGTALGADREVRAAPGTRTGSGGSCGILAPELLRDTPEGIAVPTELTRFALGLELLEVVELPAGANRGLETPGASDACVELSWACCGLFSPA